MTRKEKSRQKRSAKVNELLDYFTQAYNAIFAQYPKEAMATALVRTEGVLNSWVKKSPQEKSFFFDVLIEFRQELDKKAAMLGWQKVKVK